METSLLLPGQERVERIANPDGPENFRYLYCSERGQLFSCAAKSLEDAYAKCERWLELHEYR